MEESLAALFFFAYFTFPCMTEQIKEVKENDIIYVIGINCSGFDYRGGNRDRNRRFRIHNHIRRRDRMHSDYHLADLKIFQEMRLKENETQEIGPLFFFAIFSSTIMKGVIFYDKQRRFKGTCQRS